MWIARDEPRRDVGDGTPTVSFGTSSSTRGNDGEEEEEDVLDLVDRDDAVEETTGGGVDAGDAGEGAAAPTYPRGAREAI